MKTTELIARQSENLISELNEHCEKLWEEYGPIAERDSIAIGYLLQKVAALQLMVVELTGQDPEKLDEITGFRSGSNDDLRYNLLRYKKKEP